MSRYAVSEASFSTGGNEKEYTLKHSLDVSSQAKYSFTIWPSNHSVHIYQTGFKVVPSQYPACAYVDL